MNTNDIFNLFEGNFSDEEKNIVLEFFIGFSRFEFALKSANFLNGNGNRFSPNWDTFVGTIRDNFDQTRTQILDTAVNYIINSPPTIQSLDNGVLLWVARQNQNEPLVNRLKTHICDIRNNLFHGGKFNTTYQHEITRNTELIKSATVILNEWLFLSPQLHQEFSHPFL
jgi:hypothetical protein